MTALAHLAESFVGAALGTAASRFVADKIRNFRQRRAMRRAFDSRAGRPSIILSQDGDR